MNIFELIFIRPLVFIMDLFLGFMVDFTSSYGISIILLSIFVNTLLIPIYNYAEKLQKRERDIQSSMRPELKDINSSFKGEEKYIKTTELYKKYSYHPIYSLRSTLGFFIQVPFFIAAYTFLSNLEVLQGQSFLFLNNLGTQDGILGFINVMPFIMTFFNLFSSFFYSKGFIKSEKIKLVGIALLFLVLLYKSPAGLLLYWTFNNIYSLIKMLILHKKGS
ncbi:MAG: membrane protein insertase YidC [Spirochaetaceae bacterium]